MITLRELSTNSFRAANTKTKFRITKLREKLISKLAKSDVICLQDVNSLDRIGRFTVAQSLYNQCDDSTKQYLLHDEHAHVRSAAAISQQTLGK